jgi:hypothetical protein
MSSDSITNFLGVKIIDYLIHQASNHFVLLLVQHALNHMMEIGCLDVLLDNYEEFLLCEV